MRTAFGLFLLIFLAAVLPPGSALARTLVLDGSLASRITMSQQMSFSVDRPLERLEFRFALPAEFRNLGVSQALDGLDVAFSPQPESVADETDRFGNRFRKVAWRNLTGDVRVAVTFTGRVKAALSAMESKAPFPVKGIPKGEEVFLRSTAEVQSDSREIAELAAGLTAHAATEYEAITAVLNHVSDTVRYAYNPPQYDALYTLRSGSGNCQNFAHIAMALLRAAGIPARIVGGISLKEPWKIPIGHNSFLAQSMGQGGHAWIEIYFPDLGWLSYDPQQSRQFTSSRHIKQTHGLDSHDINDSWRGAPYVPRYSEQIDAKFLDDTVALTLASSTDAPRGYQVSNRLVAKAAAPPPLPKPPEKPPKPVPPKVVETPEKPVKPVPPKVVELPEKPVKPAPPKERKQEFGNMEFPSFVDLYQVVGDTGTKVLDKETAEYVTSRHVFAQAFTLNGPLRLESVSLAMRKFGGDGSVYVDLVTDDGGKPGFAGSRSNLVFLDQMTRKQGYYWVDFSFPGGSAILKPGKYWIVLRHSGEAIVNWFFTPGKHYGDPDDTRSTSRGYQWEDILNYEFVFRVRGTEG
jgi:transglutaminase-like putative cysteine protease